MSGNQEPRISLPTWQCRDLNVAIPIKKRKYFVQPQLPAMEEAGSALSQQNPLLNEQGDTSVGWSSLDSPDANENQKMIDGSLRHIREAIPSFPTVSVGNSDKPKNIGNISLEQTRVKVEEPSGFEIPSSFNLPGTSLRCSLGKLPVGAEHPGVASDETGMKIEEAVLNTRDIERETRCEENLKEKGQTEASAAAGTVSRWLDCKTKNISTNQENLESTSLNLSLGKDGFVPNMGSSSICAKSSNHSGVNRSNWDLNTTMNAWEDALDHTTRIKTTDTFLNSNKSLLDKETLGCRDINVISKSVSEGQKESVGFEEKKESVGFQSPTSMQFHHQVNPTCSLSLGLSSYPPIEKSHPAITTAEARAPSISFFRPIMMAGNVNSVMLRTVKSEVIEDNVRQETERAQVCPIGLSNKRVKQEVVGRFSQETSSSSNILKPLDIISPSSILKPNPISVKVEPINFMPSEVSNKKKDGALNHPHRPITESDERLDLFTSSTPNQTEKYIPCSNGISNVPTSVNGMTTNPGVQSYPDYTLKENSGQSSGAANSKLCEVLKHGGVHMTNSGSGHGDHNLNASGVNVTSLTKEKVLDNPGTSKGFPCNSRGSDELRVSDEEKILTSGKEPLKELYSYGFESDCGHDLSRVIEKDIGKRNLYGNEKVEGPAAVFAKDYEVGHAECGGSEIEQRDINVPFQGHFKNSNHVEEEGSQPAFLGNTCNQHIKETSASSSTNTATQYTVNETCSELVEMASVQTSRLGPELQSGIFDRPGEKEGRVVQDGEQSTHQIIHASEGMSGVSTVSGGNVENPEMVDNSSRVSYKEEISDPPAEFSEGSQSRIINLAQVSNNSPIKASDASGSFAPLRMEIDRLPEFQFEPRKYLFRGSDESCKFSRERYHGKTMRNPRLNYMPDRRRLSGKTESNLLDRDTKTFGFDNHGNTRRGGAFMSNFNRGRRPANDEATPFPHSFPRRNQNFSFTHRGPTNKEDASAFDGFQDREKFTRGLQCSNTEPSFMSTQRPYQGRNGYFARGRGKFSDNPKRGFPGFRSRSPNRSRERSDGSSSSLRNRSQEELSEHTEFPHRRSPSGYRMERKSSPDRSGYQREMIFRRQNSQPYSNRQSNGGRGRGYARGRGYTRGTRGRGYGRDGISFRKPSDHRYHGNFNNFDPRERVDYSDDFFEGPTHSERFGGDVNVAGRQFGYRHDGTSSSRPYFNNDGCALTNVENGPESMRFGQNPDTEIEEQGSLMAIDRNNKNSTESASGRTDNMEEEETNKTQ